MGVTPRAWTRGLLGSWLNLVGALGGLAGFAAACWGIVELHRGGVLPGGGGDGSVWWTLGELLLLANLPTAVALGSGLGWVAAFATGWPVAVALDVVDAGRGALVARRHRD